MRFYFLLTFTFILSVFNLYPKGNYDIDIDYLQQNRNLTKIDIDTSIVDTVKIVRVTDFFNLIKKSNKQNRNKKGLLNFTYNYDSFPDYYNFSDTIIISPIFLPIVFNGEILDKDLNFMNENKFKSMNNSLDYNLIDNDSIVGFQKKNQFNFDDNTLYTLLNEEESLQSTIDQMIQIKNMRRMYYVSNPEQIKIKDSDLNFEIPLNISSAVTDNSFRELLKADDVELQAPSVSVKKIKQKLWNIKFKNELDISQTSYTDNWDSQGSSTTQLTSIQRIDAIYRKNKIEFTNWTEWKLAIQYWSLTDEEKENKKSSLILNEDYIRSYNKIGLDAFIKRWAYILSVDFKTPLFVKKDKDNKEKKIASILSPLTMNIGLGAGYKLQWNSKKNKSRNLDMSIDAQPFSLEMKYVSSDEVWNNNNNGVVYVDEREGDRRYSKFEFGYKVKVIIDYKINSYISFYSRNDLFSNYHKQIIESENTFNFTLNKYLATKLYFYGKFNDSDRTKKDDKLNYFSYTNSIRFGLSFNW